MRLVYHALIVLGVLTSAAPAIAGYKGYGVGESSCGTWLQDRKSDVWYEDGQWVLGYISAYGYYGSYDLKKVDSQAFIVWIDNYCQKNPLEDIETAVQKLIETLKTNKR